MAKYLVTLPIAGEAVIEVEADSAKAAIKTAMNLDLNPDDMDVSWELYNSLVEGNVFYGPCDKAYAEEIDE